MNRSRTACRLAAHGGLLALAVALALSPDASPAADAAWPPGLPEQPSVVPATWDDATLDRMILGEDPLAPEAAPTAAPGRLEMEAMRVPWLWDGQFSLGLGWSSNPLFLDQGEPSSTFLAVELELSALRPARDSRWSRVAYLLVEQKLHLTQRPRFPDETLAMAYGRLTGRWSWLTVNLAAQASYSDQAFGVAVSPVASDTFDLTAWSFLLHPEAEARLPAGFFLQLGTPAERVFFDPSSEDYWEPAVQIGAGWQGRHDQIGLIWRRGYRDHDDRPYRSLFGNPRPGTHLVWHTSRADLFWRHTWFADRSLRTAARLRWRDIVDNGAGHDDASTWEVRLDAAWQAGPWSVEALASYAEPRYRFQRPVIAEPIERAQEQLYLDLRVAREFGTHWRLQASLSYDQLLSNKAGEDFRQTVVSVRLARLLGNSRLNPQEAAP